MTPEHKFDCMHVPVILRGDDTTTEPEDGDDDPHASERREEADEIAAPRPGPRTKGGVPVRGHVRLALQLVRGPLDVEVGATKDFRHVRRHQVQGVTRVSRARAEKLELRRVVRADEGAALLRVEVGGFEKRLKGSRPDSAAGLPPAWADGRDTLEWIDA